MITTRTPPSPARRGCQRDSATAQPFSSASARACALASSKLRAGYAIDLATRISNPPKRPSGRESNPSGPTRAPMVCR